MTLHQTFASLLLTVAIVAPVRAQPQQRNIQRLAFYRIKPDRVADFVTAAKEFVEVQKKASSHRDYTVWSSLTGDREFALVELYDCHWS